MFEIKDVKKIKTPILASVKSPPPEIRATYNVETYSTVKQAAEDNIIRPILFAYWLNNATDTHSEYIILISFHGSSGVSRTCLNVAFMRTLFVFLLID
jgi:hypothetical protein